MQEAIAFVTKLVEWLMSPTAAMVAWGLFLFSEALAKIPAVKSNSVYQVVSGVVKFVYEKIGKKSG